MLLQQIVEKLEAELLRLQAIREIVASLETGPPLSDPTSFMEADAPPAQLEEVEDIEDVVAPIAVAAAQNRVRRPRIPRTSPRPKPQIVQALAKAIPTGPVVISPAALAKEREARATRPRESAEAEPRPKPGSLGAMIRSLELRTSQLSK